MSEKLRKVLKEPPNLLRAVFGKDNNEAEKRTFEVKTCPRQVAALDVFEQQQAGRTTALPIAIAELEATHERLVQEHSQIAEPASGAKRLLLYAMGVAGVIGDALMCMVPAANLLGIPIGELHEATVLEILQVLTLTLVVGAFNLIMSELSAKLITRRSSFGAAVAVVVVSLNCVVGYLRVGGLETAVDLSEWALYAVVPAILSLGTSVSHRLADHEAEPWHAKRSQIERVQAEIDRRRRELSAVWAERMAVTAVLDGLTPEATPYLPMSPKARPPTTPSWVTTVIVLVTLALAAFLFAGCNTSGSQSPPVAVMALIDTSPSMQVPPMDLALATVRSAHDAEFLRGGSELWMFETGLDDVHLVQEPLVIPRRFKARANVDEERGRVVDAYAERLQTHEFAKGDSLITLGLKRIGAALATTNARQKVVLLASDGRDYRANSHYFGEKVPEPNAFVERLEGQGALPNLDNVVVFLCGAGTHRSENGKAFGEQQNAAMEAALRAVIEHGGGTLTVLPSCSSIDISRAFHSLNNGAL